MLQASTKPSHSASRCSAALIGGAHLNGVAPAAMSSAEGQVVRAGLATQRIGAFCHCLHRLRRRHVKDVDPRPGGTGQIGDRRDRSGFPVCRPGFSADRYTVGSPVSRSMRAGSSAWTREGTPSPRITGAPRQADRGSPKGTRLPPTRRGTDLKPETPSATRGPI